MKGLDKYGIKEPEILLPKQIDTTSWAVIACDQYTQDKNYWNTAKKIAGKNPSTLNLILPEIFLNSPDKPEKIRKIKETMKSYYNNNIFSPEKQSFLYLERKTSFERTRKGLMMAIDLDTYQWKPFSKSFIRATEATISERIPPRMEIRKGAKLEIPHIMLLVNDPKKRLIEKTGNIIQSEHIAPVYKGNLMNNGGSIKGWYTESAAAKKNIKDSIQQIAKENTAEDGSIFLFAVGDGNHSLATAKAVWDEYRENLKKQNIANKLIENSPVRYALVEVVNIYDDGLTFEPIHRVLFDIDSKNLCTYLSKKLGGTLEECKSKEKLENSVKISKQNFGFIYIQNGIQKYTLLKTHITELPISLLQPAIDTFFKENNIDKSKIDFIHGTDQVFQLGTKENITSILLPPIAKDSFFTTINKRGPLPRKSFSMGEADEKRFYFECRKLFD